MNFSMGGFFAGGILFSFFTYVIGMVILYFVIRLAIRHGLRDVQGDMHMTVREAVKSALREHENRNYNKEN